ncbi:MAG: ABC transporter permease [Paracoccaceae bacterium]|jgi:spermidine/putrescine transport system permease protein|nr:ABC transporter permease [Paracoccaceae bacterium]
MSDVAESSLGADQKMRNFPLTKLALYPAILYSFLFFIVPFAVMICVSFWQRGRGGLQATWVTDNYDKFFSRPYLVEALYNSLEVTLLTTVVSVLIAYPLAYILAFRVPSRWQKLILLITVLPFWTAYVVRSYSWLLILADNGIINTTLMGIGLTNEPLTLAYTRGATVLGFVHFFTMLLTLTIYSNLIQIPKNFKNAAYDLGASPLQAFLKVTLPLSIPGVAVGAFLTFVITIGDYITPQILGGNTEVLIPQAIILQVSRSANFPMAAVMSIVLMLVVTLVYLVFSKQLKMDQL